MKLIRLDGDRCRIRFEYPHDVDLREMDRDHDAMIHALAGRVEVLGPREVLRGDAGVAMEFPGRVLPGHSLPAEVHAVPVAESHQKAPTASGTAGVDLAAVQEAASAAKGQVE